MIGWCPPRLRHRPQPVRRADAARGRPPVRGVVVVVHGGFWRHAYDLELGRPLAADLAAAGSRPGTSSTAGWCGGGGWPATFDDVAAAVDALAGPVQQAAGGRLPLDRVVAVGHSAGGQLAAWLAARPGLPAGAPGVRRRGSRCAARSARPVCSTWSTRPRTGLGRGAVEDLLGGPPGPPSPTATRSPPRSARVPIGVPVIVRARHRGRERADPADRAVRRRGRRGR